MLDEIWEDEKMSRPSQSALMRYRRKYLEKFEENGWVVSMANEKSPIVVNENLPVLFNLN